VIVIDSCRIGVFGNDVIDGVNANGQILIDGHNNQYIYDFSKNTCSKPYDSLFKSLNIRTLTNGRSRIFNNGDIYVEETMNGRILFGDYNKLKWSYIERIDKTKINIFSWTRYFTEEEYKKLTFINLTKK
jgi:hypothetical protein